MGIKLSLKENIKINFAGMLLILTPFATGEVIRTHFLKQKYNQPYVKTIPAIFMERYHDLVSLVSIVAIMLFFKDLLIAKILVMILSIILLISFILIKKRTFYERITVKISSIKYFKKFTENTDQIHDALNQISTKKNTFFAWLLTSISYLFDAVSAYFVFVAFNIPIDFVFSTLLVYTATLFGAVSFLPGGFGITEGSLLNLLLTNGLDFAKASALILFIRLTSIWFSQCIGFTYYKLMRLDRV
jgi:hypothetical protein